jgi:uncharacterized membrane protein YdbT with pleckstrin-like domain
LPYKSYLLALPVLGIVLFLIAELKQFTSEKYIITNLRIIEKKGLLSISENYTTWKKVSSSTVRQSILERLFNVGCIDIWTIGGEDKPEITIEKAGNVWRLKKLVDELIKRY